MHTTTTTWQALLVLVGLWLSVQTPALAAWRCDENPKPIRSYIPLQIDAAFREDSFDGVLQRLNQMLGATTGDSKVAVYEAIAIVQGTAHHYDEAIAIYRSVFDMEEASARAREKARDNLAMIMADRGQARDIIALYERADRPICSAPSAEASYALSLAYNAVGNDPLARKFFDEGQANAELVFKQQPFLWNKWLLLQLRLDCVQKQWAQCGADLEELAKTEWRSNSATKQLNIFIARFRTMSQMADVLEQMQRDGLVDEHGLMPQPAKKIKDLEIISCPKPHFPVDAQLKGVNGSVTLVMEIDATGRPQSLEVMKSDPPGAFDRVALEVAAGCRYKPATFEGKPIASSARRTFVYRANQSRKQ